MIVQLVVEWKCAYIISIDGKNGWISLLLHPQLIHCTPLKGLTLPNASFPYTRFPPYSSTLYYNCIRGGGGRLQWLHWWQGQGQSWDEADWETGNWWPGCLQVVASTYDFHELYINLDTLEIGPLWLWEAYTHVYVYISHPSFKNQYSCNELSGKVFFGPPVVVTLQEHSFLFICTHAGKLVGTIQGTGFVCPAADTLVLSL